MKIFLTILFTVFAVSAFAQKVDTIVFHYSKYSFAKTEETRKYNRKTFIYKLGYNVFRFNGKDSIIDNVFEEVSKEEYDTFIQQEKKFSNCISCWQKYYNQFGVLVREGLFNTDCPIGETRSYHEKTGKLKIVERWRLLTDNEKSKLKIRCSMKTGNWLYFKPDGSKEKMERYKDDVLIETITF